MSFDQREQYLNRFFLVSLILHAILFITYPKWSSILISDIPGVERGGVIQVFMAEASPASLRSSVTNPLSKTDVPRVNEPRPTTQAPVREAVAERQAVVEDVAPRPKPNPEPDPVPVVEQQPAPPVTTEARPDVVRTQPEVPREPPPEVTKPAEILTSEGGTPLLVPETVTEVQVPDRVPIPEIPVTETPPVVTESPEGDGQHQTEADPKGPSGSGSAETFGESEEEGGRQSGMGESETAAPAPPPPPRGSEVVRSGGNVSFPKEAEHDKVAGIVTLEVVVSASGQTMAIRTMNSSGDQRLDIHARRTIERIWNFERAGSDYIVIVDVEFIWEEQIPGFSVASANVNIVDVKWLEE